MGKWCYVNCSCPNRVSMGSRYGAYQCGHAGGALLQFCPGFIVEMGQILWKALKHEPHRAQDFKILIRISDPQNYDGDCLTLSCEERDLWRLEIEELQAAKRGKIIFSSHAMDRWNALWRKFFRDPWRRENAESVDKILAECIRLCDASATLGNPIEFEW